MRSLAWLLALTVGSAMGCSSGTEPAPEGKTLRIGYLGNTHHAAHFAAMEKGLYQEGLKKVGVTTIADTMYANGGQEMDAMRDGKLDIAFVGLSPVIAAKLKDPPLDAKIVATIGLQGSTMVVSNDVAIAGSSITLQELKALKDHKIVTLSAGSIQDAVLKMWLAKNEVSYSGDSPEVTIEGVANAPDAILSLNNKDVQAVFYPEPWPTKALAGANQVAIRSGEMWPNHPCCVLVISGKLIAEDPALVKEVVRVVKQAAEYTVANEEEIATIVAKKIGEDENMVKKSMLEWDGKFGSSPHDAIPGTLEIVAFQNKAVTESDLFDTSFFDQL